MAAPTPTPYLKALVSDFKALCELTQPFMLTSAEKAMVESLQADLSKFEVILNEGKEYTQKQVEGLTKAINAVVGKMRHVGDAVEIERRMREQFTQMNEGSDPIESIKIKIEFKPDFVKKMQAIGDLCEKIEEDANELAAHAQGVQYGYLKKFAMACQDAVTVVQHFLQEVNYYCRQFANFIGIKRRTPEDKIERARRDEAYASRIRKEGEAEQLGAKMFKEQQNARKPRIFK